MQPSLTDRKRANLGKWSLGLLLVPPLTAVALVGVTLRHYDLNEPFFVNSAFYVLFVMLAVYAGVLALGKASLCRSASG